MSQIKIHIFHTGKVCVSPYLPFGGEDCSQLKASGMFTKKEDRLWLPVSAYFIEHPKGKILVDTGWDRAMSPNGIIDKKAQIKSLGSHMLYIVNQGLLPPGEGVDEQLAALGVKTSELDYVLLTHLDCDHANGLPLVKDAKNILVSAAELTFATKGGSNNIRYQDQWWKNVPLKTFDWNAQEGPFARSYDLFGDGSVQMINIPGHAEGQCAVKITGSDGHFVLLFADGGYARKSWEDMILSGIADNREEQKKSLEWIRSQSLDPLCVESLATHDAEVVPHVITLV